MVSGFVSIGSITVKSRASSFCTVSASHRTFRVSGKKNRSASRVWMKTMDEVSQVGKKRSGNEVSGKVFVCGDNIDTDQIIPAEFLTLVPSVADEYEQLGGYAMWGLPDSYETRYVNPGELKTPYEIIIAGDNFGCGSSREHAPIAIGAAGGRIVVAQSYARIFFRNCSATGELYPWETDVRVVDKFQTGDTATLRFEEHTITNDRTGEVIQLRSLGDVLPVVDAGGIFEYARRTGMMSSKAE